MESLPAPTSRTMPWAVARRGPLISLLFSSTPAPKTAHKWCMNTSESAAGRIKREGFWRMSRIVGLMAIEMGKRKSKRKLRATESFIARDGLWMPVKEKRALNTLRTRQLGVGEKTDPAVNFKSV